MWLMAEIFLLLPATFVAGVIAGVLIARLMIGRGIKRL